MASDDFWILLM